MINADGEMSELQTRYITDTYLEYFNTGKHALAQIYLKPEADAVIAEKDEEIRRLRRALYKACANWAHHRVFVRFNSNEKAWESVERKCRAKAEQYMEEK